MSPIDDELRTALQERARALPLSADPLARIEERARRMRRHRAAAAVTGSALAAALVAAAVPAVQSAVAPRQDAPSVAESQPPVADLDPSRYALDPADPWRMRGNLVSESDRAMIQGEYATRTGGAEVLVTPLYAGTYEAGALTDVVFLAAVDGEYRWGVASFPTEAGLDIAWDEPLPEPALALAAALPGDEAGARLIVVASPDAGPIYYGTEGADEASIDSGDATGVAVTGLERDPASDFYRVFVDGDELVRAPAPDPKDITQVEPVDAPETAVVPEGHAFDPAEPWEFRGQGDPVALVEEADRLFAQTFGQGWSGRALYAADSDAGVRVLLRLHIKAGSPALVSTTWRVGDRAAQQDDQVVDAGQALIQASVPTEVDGSRLLVALGAPRASGIVLTGAGGNRPDGMGDPGVGLWIVQDGEEAVVRLYTEGDEAEYLVQPARTS